MKINARSFKHIKSYVVFCLLVTLMFPYSLLATEQNYRVPKNSLSYFLQNPSQKKYLETTTESPSGSVIPPLTSIENVRGHAPVTEEIIQPVEETSAIQEVYTSKPVATVEPADLQMSWRNETPTEMHVQIHDDKSNTIPTQVVHNQEALTRNVRVATIEKSKTTPIEIARDQGKYFNNTSETKKNIKQITTNKPTVTASSPETTSLFARALAKMRSKKASREAEAQRLGVTLPSHTGDLASVSPSLSKINSAVNQILARHAANSSRV